MQPPLAAGTAIYEVDESSFAGPSGEEAPVEGVSWGAIVAGAFAAAGLALILVALGAGFGISSVSPWSGASASTAALGTGAVIWLVVTQWLSAAVGGYLAGRLRTKWVGIHTHEVFFRDTAHGFLAWAVAVVLCASVLASVMSSLAGNTAQAGATMLSGAAQNPQNAAQGTNALDPTPYYVDLLFRSDKPNGTDAATRDEAGRILAYDLRNGGVSAGDRQYLARLVADRTGLSQADAEKRVDDVTGRAKAASDEAANRTREAAETARKATAIFAFAASLSMFIGAFIASAAGALGGRQRDESGGALPQET